MLGDASRHDAAEDVADDDAANAAIGFLQGHEASEADGGADVGTAALASWLATRTNLSALSHHPEANGAFLP